MKGLQNLIKDLSKLQDPQKAQILQGFFKTGKGQYGEGDIFLGITVPDQRKIAQKYKDLAFSDVEKLLKSKIHEHRLTALLILVQQFKNANEITRKKIVNFYLKSTKYINNWDLVDLSANHILGTYLLGKDTSILKKLAKSKNLWERRIAMIATLAYITKNEFKEALVIAQILLNDTHDLIHKAVGWMLREVGKRNQTVEEEFLKKHYKQMPRTMLRYELKDSIPKRKNFTCPKPMCYHANYLI